LQAARGGDWLLTRKLYELKGKLVRNPNESSIQNVSDDQHDLGEKFDKFFADLVASDPQVVNKTQAIRRSFEHSFRKFMARRPAGI